MIGMFGFCGLAIDLGLLAVSRTQCQNAADSSALTACRLLNTKPASVNSNLGPAVAEGKVRASSNTNLNQAFTNAQIQKVEVGQYLYDTSAQIFRVATWTDVTNSQAATPGSGSWTAIRVTLAVSQPTYFMKAFGVTTMPTGAKATAVYRPRDTAFVIDMTGSMGNGSIFNLNSCSLNPDDLVPSFGHYKNLPSGNGTGSTAIRCTQNQLGSGNQANPQNNFCVSTPGGPPIVRNFYFDPRNLPTGSLGDPKIEAFPLLAAPSKNAFHRWSPPESGGNSATSTPVVYDFTGYDPTHLGNEASPKGPVPAPNTFGTMTDGVVNYSGDRWRRVDGSIDKADTTWTGAKQAASSALDLLGYTTDSLTAPTMAKTSSGTNIIALTSFRDPAWETYGYDLKLDGATGYRSTRGNNPPLAPGAFTTQVPAADKFVGYSMGPGYWGKTFYIWPPDPRTPVNDPGQAGYVPGDWRQRYFNYNDGSTWGVNYDTQGATTPNGINSNLLNTGGGMVLAGGTANWKVDYPAVLKWIKSGPMVLPPNLRAGHILYYSSIPDDVDTATGTTQTKLDKVWWKKYIDYVLSYNRSNTSDLYGTADSWSVSGAGRTVNALAMVAWTGPLTTWPSKQPYMAYADRPNRPRLHFWFGPLSMMDFMQIQQNWLPGTSNEAHCWQLKAGMNSVLDDVKNNHPNNYVGLTMFSSSYNDIRRPMGQKFDSLKNAMFYPKSLLDTIDLNNGGTSITNELRPYNLSFNPVNYSGSGVGGDEVPSASGSTDPVTGFAYAFNLLSPSTGLPAQYGTVSNKGRRGAGKLVIFETDGVPNMTRSVTPTLNGYNTFYPTAVGGGSSATGDAITVVNQLVKLMATSGSGDSGMSLPNSPCRVYPIAFGDLFDIPLAPSAKPLRISASQFLASVATAGNTGTVANATGEFSGPTLPLPQFITGSYTTRITTLRSCMENIFQSGVGVTLVE